MKHEELFKQCELLLTELRKFDKSMISLGEAIDDKRLEDFEMSIGFKFPLDFKYILRKYNRIVLDGVEIYGLDKKLRGTSLNEVYEYEHKENIYNAMPSEFLPFSESVK